MTTGGRRFRASGHTLQRSSSPAIAPCAIGAMCDEATGLERRSHLPRNAAAGAERRVGTNDSQGRCDPRALAG